MDNITKPLFINTNKEVYHDTLKSWYSSMEDYTGRSLTIPTDKLPAISGYAHALHQVIGGEYLAGLWGNDLLRGLLWGPTKGQRLRQPTLDGLAVKRAPSWSWAALDHDISYDLLNHLSSGSYRLIVQKSSVTLLGLDPMGEVYRGSLVVHGRFKKVAVQNRRTVAESWRCSCSFDSESCKLETAWCLWVVDSHELLLDFSPETNTYRRVGLFQDNCPRPDTPMSTITIV